jgi:hypothetical protein
MSLVMSRRLQPSNTFDAVSGNIIRTNHGARNGTALKSPNTVTSIVIFLVASTGTITGHGRLRIETGKSIVESRSTIAAAYDTRLNKRLRCVHSMARCSHVRQ